MNAGRAPDGRHPYQQIADTLRSEIETGMFPTKLPSTGALQKRFGVSRMTARSAVYTLRQEGLVRTEQGKGVFVQRVDDQNAVDTSFPQLPEHAASPGAEPESPSGDPVISRLDALHERVEGGLGIVLERLDAIERRLPR